MKFSVRTAIIFAGLCTASLAAGGTPSQALVLTNLALPSLMAADLPNVSKIKSVPQDLPVTAIPTETAADSVDVPVAADAAETETPATLAELVAAQQLPETIDGELACLATTIYFESKGEPLSGQLAVAQVVINRTQSGRFPQTLCSVVKQPGQFSFVRGGHMPSVNPLAAAYRRAVAVAMVAMAKGWESPAGSALFFHARRVSPGWRLTKVAAIGQHVFYR